MNYDIATEEATIEAELLTWMAVHGNICLALRHPENRSQFVRPRMIRLVKEIGAMLVERGFMTQAELDGAMKYEMQQGNDLT